MKNLKDVRAILDACFKKYIEDFGKVDFEKTLNKIRNSKTVDKFLYISEKQAIKLTGDDFVNCVHSIPYFIFSGWNRICLGSLFVFDKWNLQVNDKYNILNEGELIKAIFRIIEYSKADYIDMNIIYKADQPKNYLEILTAIFSIIGNGNSIVGLIRGSAISINYNSENESVKMLISRKINKNEEFADVSLEINNNKSNFEIPKRVLYASMIASKFLDKKTRIKFNHVFPISNNKNESEIYFDIIGFMIKTYEDIISNNYPNLNNHVTIEKSEKYGNEIIFRLSRGDEDPHFRKFFYDELLQRYEIENLKIAEVDAIVVIDQIARTHAVYNIQMLEDLLE